VQGLLTGTLSVVLGRVCCAGKLCMAYVLQTADSRCRYWLTDSTHAWPAAVMKFLSPAFCSMYWREVPLFFKKPKSPY